MTEDTLLPLTKLTPEELGIDEEKEVEGIAATIEAFVLEEVSEVGVVDVVSLPAF